MELRRASSADELPVRVQIVDEKTDEFVSAKLEWPVAKDEATVAPAKTMVRIEVPEAILRTSAAPPSLPIASAKRGTILFVADADVKNAKGRSGAATEAWQREPPRIAISPDPLKGAPVVEGETLRLQGTASLPPSIEGTRGSATCSCS